MKVTNNYITCIDDELCNLTLTCVNNEVLIQMSDGSSECDICINKKEFDNISFDSNTFIKKELNNSEKYITISAEDGIFIIIVNIIFHTGETKCVRKNFKDIDTFEEIFNNIKNIAF